jgi:hypothetical protein
MTHRDRMRGPSGRRKVAGDVAHRQDIPTPSEGPRMRPERRFTRIFGRRCAGFMMPRITTSHAPGRKPW